MLLGIYITFVYDVLRILRRALPHRKFFVSLEDLAFWVYCGGEVFLLMYREADGSLRWFAVLGALTGMLLYKKLVSGWLVRYVSAGLKRILKFLSRFLGKLLSPARFVCRKAKRGIGKLRRRLAHAVRGIKIRLTYRLKMLKMTLKSR
jgi:spore cortex biosynthesis protein YabQ